MMTWKDAGEAAAVAAIFGFAVGILSFFMW